ncbi:hypothetical protein HNP84_006793 [Thermocatellispora tengchongensis]|uniref:Uncharacterized protein n=1 Tax=Thermocatellispora tengchongensis TaxID=1073253 RepID=A0A840PGT6_9ACTN|nr:hypothetical protein [Thermocatellispora tengchongensis]MBB5137041.1 hypothetical protein [Thermocatellispora tengchongensis]
MESLLALHAEAVRAGSTLVTGAGFGVLATEALVAKLRDGRPTPHRRLVTGSRPRARQPQAAPSC